MRALIAATAFLIAPAIASAQHDPHWTYEGKDGPANWGSLAPAYAACAAGTRQSPVDIPSASPLSPDPLRFTYSPGLVELLANGHTIQLNVEAGNSIELNGTHYRLIQLHFHTPSEHSISGRREAMEMHLVHRDSAGGLAVIGVLLREGASNPDLEQVLGHMPKFSGRPAAITSVKFDPARLLPSNREHWTYEGSLTTPPCSEGVTWLVLKHSVELSRTQIDLFTAALHHNARPLQPIGTRAIGIRQDER